MRLPDRFIWASAERNELDSHVPAPYFRKTFDSDCAAKAHVVITACGFYKLYLNGRHLTKGALAPYISNPTHLVYYDEYDIDIVRGKNAVGVWLGNGFQNNPGGHIWDFDKSIFRSAPLFAMSVTWKDGDGNEHIIESDESFLTHPSPITFDDYRFGEHYDARLECDGWNTPDSDDSDWKNALIAPVPTGEKRVCEAEPIVAVREIKPVSITPEDGGFRYDFGENCAGVCRLSVKGTKGQQIDMIHVERLVNDKISFEGLWFYRNEEQWQHDISMIHRDIYICKGDEREEYTPSFTYHGFRYVLVRGITEEQATEDLLTYVVMNSDIKERGDFSCSDPIANTLQEMTRRSDLANFYYFPTDCPQREKNGWTADAALSAEQMLLNFEPEVSYREWLRNIRKAQNDEGMIPGIVPTDTWGYGKGFGPAWDCILVYLPYYVYIYRGETDMIKDSANAFLSYIHFLTTKTNEEGLIRFGLGDWCPVGRDAGDAVAPLEFTCTVMAMDVARKAAFLFDVVGMAPERDYANAVADSFRNVIREKLIDSGTMTAIGNCQTTQAMAIYYDVFENGEKPAATERLLELVKQKNNTFDTGVLGGRVLFHVLARGGYADLAYRMITGPDYPSYGNIIMHGATSLWEQFDSDLSRVSSMNHHFWGDISSFFFQYVAGIRMNPVLHDVNNVNIAPMFISGLEYAQGFHEAPAGKVSCKWKREDGKIILETEVPEAMYGRIILPSGYVFKDGMTVKTLKTGKYIVFKQ